MSGRAHELAARFRDVNEGAIRFVEGCSEADWRRMVAHEGRTVAFLLDHIAWAYAVETKAMLACVTGREQPLAWDEVPHTFTMVELHAVNAARWEADPYPDRAATIARLRAEGEKTVSAIERLSDDDLERTVTYGPFPGKTAAEFIERPLLSHPGMHLPGIMQALATAPAPSGPTGAQASEDPR